MKIYILIMHHKKLNEYIAIQKVNLSFIFKFQDYK